MASRKQEQLLEVESERSDIIKVPLDSLHPDPANLRGLVDPQDPEIIELAGSILSAGLISPLTVRMRPEGGYFLVAGHRRAAACRVAGLETVHAVLRKLSDFQVTEIMLTENGLRQRLEPHQEAEGYRILLASGKYTVQGLADRLKIRPQRIWERLHFLEDGPELTEAVTSGRLPPSVADVVRSTAKALHTTPGLLLQSMSEDIAGEWTARQVREFCKKRKAYVDQEEQRLAKVQADADMEREQRNRQYAERMNEVNAAKQKRYADILGRMRALPPERFWEVVRHLATPHLEEDFELQCDELLRAVVGGSWDIPTHDDVDHLERAASLDSCLQRVESELSNAGAGE
jgi:ParB/RepB/Spo0J family partition protein